MKKIISSNMMFSNFRVFFETLVGLLLLIISSICLVYATINDNNDVTIFIILITVCLAYKGLRIIYVDWTLPYLLLKFNVIEIVKVKCTQVDDKEFVDMFGFVHQDTFLIFDSSYPFSERFKYAFKKDFHYEAFETYNKSGYEYVMRKRNSNKYRRVFSGNECYLIRTGSIIHVFNTNEYILKDLFNK